MHGEQRTAGLLALSTSPARVVLGAARRPHEVKLQALSQGKVEKRENWRLRGERLQTRRERDNTAGSPCYGHHCGREPSSQQPGNTVTPEVVTLRASTQHAELPTLNKLHLPIGDFP